MADSSLYRTLSGATDNGKFTFSCWFKTTGPGGTLYRNITTGSSDQGMIDNGTNGTIEFMSIDGGVGAGYLKTNRKFRDPAAWYHIVCTTDYSNVTAADRMQMWINGVRETSWNAYSYPGTGDERNFVLDSTTNGNSIGSNSNSSAFFSGLMSHVNIIYGEAYAPSYFGEVDSTSGIWKIKIEPSVTYGTKGGFYKMEDSSNLGLDSSGQSNDFSIGGSLKSTKDNPDNNFCTMNSLDNFYANQTFTQGNNTVKSDYEAPATSTLGVTAGKWYCEGKCILTTSGTDWQIGIVGDQTEGTGNDIGNHGNSWGYRGSDGDYRNNYGNTSYGNTYTTGDIIGCAVDLTNNKLYFSKNGTWQNSGDPTSGATGTGAISISAGPDTPTGAYFVAAGGDSSANDYTWSLNFGNGYFGTTAVASAVADGAGIGAFEYAPPTGYYAICTKNISTYG